ncbi:MAG: hypothetical protein AABM42_10585 [Actinomycetota bacterium]
MSTVPARTLRKVVGRVRRAASASRRTTFTTVALAFVAAGIVASQALLGSPAVAASGVEITSGPSETEASSDAAFTFASSDGAASFECSLDAGAYEPCASPKSYSGLEDGPHYFAVRVQPADESLETTPAEHKWTVENLKPCTDAEEPANFPVYSLGSSVDGHEVTSVARHCEELEPEAPARDNSVTYVYGVCPELLDGTADACAPPLAIQTWPACERSLADYEVLPGVPYPHKSLGEVEGVPAYSFDEGTRVELYTGSATIVIFAADPALIDKAIEAIRAEPTSEPPGEPAPADAKSADLPPPEPGATAGKLSCE